MAEGVLLDIVAGLTANVASGESELRPCLSRMGTFKSIILSLRVKDELCKLNNSLTTIQAVLLDAEQMKDINNHVKVWLDRLEDVVYNADNLMDELHYQQLHKKLIGETKAKKVCIFFSSSNQLVYKLKMTKKIKHIKETLDEIIADQVFIHLSKRYHEETRNVTAATIMSGRETHSFVISEEVIGRDNDERQIIQLLLDSNVDTAENVAIVSLVGIGGLGKTTLAQSVFNNEDVKKHFEKQMWVCVSDVFDLKLLVQKIIRSLTSTSPDQNLDLEQLQNQLREKLWGRKYLLVLDDVWNEDRDKWDGLKTFLKLGARGSRVLITTRSTQVAQIVHSAKTLRLSALDENTSWALFNQEVAFEDLNLPIAQYHRLVEIAKRIVGKCKGVPLAIKTIGRLLQAKKYTSKNLEREWIKFRDTELAEVDNQNKTNILLTLKPSYTNLPSHLKHCFAYCSLFPKDHRFDVQQLIRLWIAQGFISKPDGNSTQLEDIGYECFANLFSRCFFQEAETNELTGAIEYCKMQDLVHDLASLVAGKSVKILDADILGELESNTNNARLDRDTRNAFEKVRHISCMISCQLPTLSWEEKQVRSFIFPDSVRLSSSDYDNFVSNFRFLRALTLRIEIDVETLPNILGKLKHLRYLDLSRNKSMKELPNSITGLHNLHTLILSNCRSLVRLPVDIQNLVNLRHLEIGDCDSLTHLPRGIGKLKSLQTLDKFVVADDIQSSESESAGFGELSELNDLRGNLVIHIRGLGKNVTYELGAAQCLKEKEYLESLVFIWDIVEEEEMMENAKKAFQCLEPPQNVKAIEVYKYPGEAFPKWVSSLNDLVQFKLYKCRKCKYLPPLHHLCSLRELTLESFSALEYVCELGDSDEWNRDDQSSTSFFPSLMTLYIKQCENLKGWWGGERYQDPDQQQPQPNFPRLTDLRISICPRLTSMPLFPDLESLELHDTSSKPLQQTIMMNLESVAASFSSSSTLSRLKDLTIEDVHDLESLPQEIGNLNSLQKLQIHDCPNLTSLPEKIRSLSSLRVLATHGCSRLTHIPRWICSLPSLEYVNDRRWFENPPLDALDDDSLWEAIMSLYFCEL